MSLDSTVVDIPILTVDQTAPSRLGPAGRLTDAKNVRVEKHIANGRSTRVKIQQREAFVSLSVECRDNVDGELSDVPWSSPGMLATLGESPVSIANSIPRVSRGNGQPWTSYPTTRVVTNRLDSEVFHTSSNTAQVTDDAWLDGVTCSVWTETTLINGVEKTAALIGFKADNGTWIISPRVLYDSGLTIANEVTQARVAVDGEGERFFVVVNARVFDVDPPFFRRVLRIFAFSTQGEELDSADLDQNAQDPGPGFWDITTRVDDGIYIAQPGAVPDNTDVGVQIGQAVFNTGTGQIGVATSVDATIFCTGPVAWLTNDTGDELAYLGTYVLIDLLFLYAWQITNLAQTHLFAYQSTDSQPDSIVGWVTEGVAEGEPSVTLGFTILSTVPQSSGPRNDPALRYTRVLSQSWNNDALVTLRQLNGVCLVSRAFRHDDEYYAFTYYQSGSGITKPTSMSVDIEVGDYMIGAQEQPIRVVESDFISGSPFSIVVPSAGAFDDVGILTTVGEPSFAITGTDTVAAVAASGLSAYGIPDGTPVLRWTFANCSLSSILFAGGRLEVTGSSIASANATWDVVGFGSTSIVYTAVTNLFGGEVVPGTFTATGNAEVLSMTAYRWPALSESFADDTRGFIEGGTIAVSGGSPAGNNGTFTIDRAISNSSPPASLGLGPALWCETTTQSSSVAGFTGLITPAPSNEFAFSTHEFDDSYIGMKLSIANDLQFPQNNQENAITAGSIGTLTVSGATGLHPQIFRPPFPDVVVRVPLDVTPYTFLLQRLTLDYTFVGAVLSIESAVNIENNGVFKITQINDDGTFYAVPIDGKTDHRNESFATPTITIFFLQQISPQFQPMWFMSPLGTPTTPHVGCFERGIAYADWRNEGNATDEPLVPANYFPMAVSSVPRADGAYQVVLPYRAESFTSGVPLVTPAGEVVNAAQVTSQSTIGLKKFRLDDEPGDPFVLGGELFIPGPMASVFTQSGFSEHGINVSPEQPFLVSQDENEDTLCLTRKGKYQIIAVFEATDENGDRIFSLPSPPLDISMSGDNNSATYGGRLPVPLTTLGATIAKHYGLTNRPKVAISLYKTSIQGGRSTVNHYKITSDLNVNARAPISSINDSGFSFPDEFTWNYKDENPDVTILSSEVLYTDKGFLPRFPCPPFRAGCVWLNRPWVVGYDRAIWTGGEKTEGDQSWFFLGFRQAQIDRPVSIAHNESFLVVPAADSIWWLPSAQLPSANGRDGRIPTAVRMQFTNGGESTGGTGLARTIQSGVAYSSSAGGVWLITRDMRNIWLSHEYEDLLDPLTITGMAVDKRQRLHVSTGTNGWFVYDQLVGCWTRDSLPSGTAKFAAIINGQVAFQDDTAVSIYTPGQYLDLVNGSDSAIPMDIQLAGISFGTIRGLKRVREFQLIGTYKGPHNINTIVSYPDEQYGPPTTRRQAPASVATPYVFAFNPNPEEATLFDVRIFSDFDGIETPGNSFELELLSAEVGLESGVGIAKTTKRLLP